MTLGRQQFWRAVFLVFSGTATAQLIPILGSLIIARLFLPAEFGVFVTWLGLCALAAVFVTGRFEMALALEPDGPARGAAATATFITTALLLAVLITIGMIVWPFISPILPVMPQPLVWLSLPCIAALAAAQIWQAWAAAEGRFKALSMMRIFQAAAITGLQILAGLVMPSALSLAIAHVAGVAAGLAVMYWQLPLHPLPNLPTALFGFWSRYRRFPIFALPADTVNTAAGQLPLIILSSRFGADIAGYVALTFRVLGAPISLMGMAVLDVFKRRASESWRETGSCRGPYTETFLVLAALSAAATLLFWFAGEDLFVFAFGAAWRMSGEAAVILLPMFALRFVASPLSYTFYIAEKQHIDLMWQICLLFMTLTALIAFDQYETTLRAYALGYGALYVIYMALSYRFSRGKTA